MNQFWKDKNVLVTGAAGFIGSWLSKELIRLGADVTALVRDWNPETTVFSKDDLQNMHLVLGELENYSLLERILNEYDIDTVFHLGAQTLVEIAFRSPLQTFESNIRGTYNLLEACRRQGRMVQRILVASSDKAYGESEVLPYVETMPLKGRTPYDVSKSCTDLIALSYSSSYQLPIVIARCGNVYGGGDLNWSRLIPGTIRNILLEKPPVIRSNGKLTRDYLYVQDAVKAYLLMAMNAEHGSVRGEAFNFGPAQPSSVLDIVEMLQRMMGSSLKPIILHGASTEIRNQVLDSSKASQVLGWSSEYSLHQGISETIKWYEGYIQTSAFKREKILEKICGNSP
ncbi:MAG: GDP-mannose 4,6-dehydratase [Chlamydiales bacterium]